MNYFSDLGSQIDSLVHNEPKKAAELLYTAAILAQKQNEPEKAASCARRCLMILSGLNIQTEEAAAAFFAPSVNGVLIPELFHEGTAADGLKAAGLLQGV